MTLEDVDGLLATWTACPPPRVTLARIGGVLGLSLPTPEPSTRSSAPMSLDEMNSLAERMNAGARVAHG